MKTMILVFIMGLSLAASAVGFVGWKPGKMSNSEANQIYFDLTKKTGFMAEQVNDLIEALENEGYSLNMVTHAIHPPRAPLSSDFELERTPSPGNYKLLIPLAGRGTARFPKELHINYFSTDVKKVGIVLSYKLISNEPIPVAGVGMGNRGPN